MQKKQQIHQQYNHNKMIETLNSQLHNSQIVHNIKLESITTSEFINSSYNIKFTNSPLQRTIRHKTQTITYQGRWSCDHYLQKQKIR
jgi:hypothetical protein